MAMAAGLLGLLLASYLTAWTGAGSVLIGGMVAVFGVVLVLRRPVVGVFILMTTFLFTYPAFLRGIGNLTINNILGLMLVPLMLYEMIRDGSWWPIRFKPFLLAATVVGSMVVSGVFYTGTSEYVEQSAQAKIEASHRAQGPALFQTRDDAAKFMTRFAFLVFFVFFVRTARDLQIVVGIVVAALLFTYFSVGTGEGVGGWGTGRLRSLSDAGGALYAGRNPNKLAYFALFGLTLLWYARRAIRHPWLYPLWVAVIAITFIMIPLTGSRSGMLNLLLFSIIVMLEGRFRFRKIVGIAAISFFIVVQFGYQMSVLDFILPQQTAERLGRVGVSSAVIEEESLEATGSAGGRFRTAQSAARVWFSYPLFGVGIGNFESERAATDPFGVVGPPHNSYLWALAEGGIVAFGLYIWLFAWTLRRIHDIRWEYEARYGPMKLGWLVSAMHTALIGFLFFSFFADMWYHDFFYIVMGMCLALIRVHDHFAETGKVPTRFLIGGGSSDHPAHQAPRPVVPRAVVVPPPTFVLHR
ncbi:MAG: O-antigen ligase family protein [Candidatus Binatia bacterium]